ncbi:MAG TPA: hypothetical protein VHI52_10725 [Verrucomicrobiae bacterium]|nr:hypothetical protein [Verrucomicrobiae bacterium]
MRPRPRWLALPLALVAIAAAACGSSVFGSGLPDHGTISVHWTATNTANATQAVITSTFQGTAGGVSLAGRSGGANAESAGSDYCYHCAVRVELTLDGKAISLSGTATDNSSISVAGTIAGERAAGTLSRSTATATGQSSTWQLTGHWGSKTISATGTVVMHAPASAEAKARGSFTGTYTLSG